MKPSPAPRELIVVAESDVGLRANIEGFTSVNDVSVDSLNQLLATENVSPQPLFGLSEELMYSRSSITAEAAPATPTMPLFYKVSAPDSQLETLAEKLRGDRAVHAAYIKPGVEVAYMSSGTEWIPLPSAPITPDLLNEQIYLRDPSPESEGINALAAWDRPGGGGAGIRIVDVEGAWRFTHEDLVENQGGVAGGTESYLREWRDHGTAVLGVLSGDRNGDHNFGIVGISPDANVRAVSVFGQPGAHQADEAATSTAIRQAADLLSEGDILLIELHLPGPTVGFQPNEDQLGYIPVEWWHDNLLAIQYAVAKGVIVVEAAGNGNCNLNDDIFEHNPTPPYGPFPADWKNPFRRANVDSGAILVGAGAPLSAINHHSWGPPRSRMAFSNFGDVVDAQGWGQDVTTCGFGHRQNGADEDRWYTQDFGGTSAAAPMVAASLACVQGSLRAAGKHLLTSLEARDLLRATGWEQTDSRPADHRPATERIGNRPDILQMMQHFGL
jgi:Subtilase family